MQQSWTVIKLQLKEIYSKLQISEALRRSGVTVFINSERSRNQERPSDYVFERQS